MQALMMSLFKVKEIIIYLGILYEVECPASLAIDFRCSWISRASIPGSSAPHKGTSITKSENITHRHQPASNPHIDSASVQMGL